jgi:hypothetical protein
MVYEADVVLPPEIYLESAQEAFSEVDQHEARVLDTNLLEEKCNKALPNMQKYLSHPDSRLNTIDRVLIPPKYTSFFGSPTTKNLGVKRVRSGAISAWVTGRDVILSVHK